jgi:tRNA dimethylallyltransferase
LLHCEWIRVEQAGSARELGLAKTLGVENPGQVGKDQPAPDGGGDRGFGTKRNPETSHRKHRQVVGAVAEGQGCCRGNAKFGRDRQQRAPLRRGVDNRRQHPAGQPVVGDFQMVGDNPLKAELGRDPFGKHHEPAGDKRRPRAGAAHRRDQGVRTRGWPNSRGAFGDQAPVGPGQQRNPGGERIGKIDLAVHRTPGDVGDARPNRQRRAHFVEHLVLDHGRFEIGHEQLFPAPVGGLHDDVDRRLTDQPAGKSFDALGILRDHKDVARLVACQPHRRAQHGQFAAEGGGKSAKTAIATGGDQGQHKPHRSPSYAAGGRSDKRQPQKPVVIIAGPTASGKSLLAVGLAEMLGGTVINADALQCYRDLEILTARPDPAAQAQAPHRLYGFLDAGERGSAGAWRERALAEIAASLAAARVPIVVGGTGLYLRALQHGLAPFPEVPEKIRREAATLHRTLGGAVFRERLARLDPASARRLPAGDTQRLVRAYAVVRATGIPIGMWRDRPHSAAAHNFVTLLLMPPRDRLYAACDARLGAMIEHGAIDEAAALAARGLDPDLPVMKAVGLPELLRHVRGEMPLAAAIAAAQQATRRYAKRQTTWFRHQSQPDLVFSEQFSESLLRRSRQFIDEFLLTAPT